MKITRAYVEEYALSKGLQRIELQGHINGFAWKEPDLEIGGVNHTGRTVTFKPLAELSDKDAITYEL